MKGLAMLRMSLMALLAGVAGVGQGGEAAGPAAKLAPGDSAPDFSLPDQDGKVHQLSACRGQWVMIYFYPKDDTPGCTAEACAVRDRFADFAQAKLLVFGINPGSVSSHKAFADKHKLQFPLLADTAETVVKAYGTWQKFSFLTMKLTGRMTFLVKPDGTIAKIYEQVDPAQHADEILADLQKLKDSEKKTGPEGGAQP